MFLLTATPLQHGVCHVCVIVGTDVIEASAFGAGGDTANGVVCLRRFVNHQELRLYYKAADIHVSASDFETLGNSCHESLLCGTPVVLERSGGYVSQVDDGQQGYLIQWADPSQAARAVAKVLAFKHAIAPRQRETTEGTVIVRAMLAAPAPVVGPQSVGGVASLMVWGVRSPLLLASLGVYVSSRSFWPQVLRQGKEPAELNPHK